MRRAELLLWSGLLLVLLFLNLRGNSAPAVKVDSSFTAAPQPHTRAPKATQQSLAKSKLYARPDEDAKPPPALAARRVVTLAADDVEEGRPTLASGPTMAAATARPLIERAGRPWPVGRAPTECHLLLDLMDSVLDGGDARERLTTGIIATFAANATGVVGDVASSTLHAVLALMYVKPAKVVALTFERQFYDTARQLFIDAHGQCKVDGYLGDKEEQLAVAGGFDVLVVGSTVHAESLAPRIIAGEIVVLQYLIIAQPKRPAGGALAADWSRIGRLLSQAGWRHELSVVDIGLVVYKNPKFDSLPVAAFTKSAATSAVALPSHPTLPEDDHAGTARFDEPPAELDESQRSPFREMDASHREDNQRDGRNLMQLRDSQRLMPKQRSALRCAEVFLECSGLCKPSLLCGSPDEELTEEESLFPNPRAAALLFRIAYNRNLPIAPYAVLLAGLVLAHDARANIVVLGCYPSLIASAAGGVRGAFGRILVYSSAEGCDALSMRMRGGLRHSLPDLSARLTTDIKKIKFGSGGGVILTTVRIVNHLPASFFDSLPPSVTVAVLGTSVPFEPLTAKARLKAMTRFHFGVGLTVFLPYAPAADE
jgi:hypothetical protein